MTVRILIPLLLLLQTTQSQSPLDRLKRGVEALGNPGSHASALSDARITDGLREALTVSTGKAVASTGRPDGFLKNAAIRIALPPNLRKTGRTLRMIGMGSHVDALEVGMNRAAEQATPAAKKIFLDALERMTFNDVRHILSGDDTAATSYFKAQCSDEMTTAFTPIVHQAMENVGVIREYNHVMRRPVAMGLVPEKDSNLDEYVVAKTLDGLFYVMGQEEKKIRKDPAARTTEILKEVFANAH